MVEPEVAFAELSDMMTLAEEFLACIVERVLTERMAELRILERDIAALEKIKVPFPRITYEEAVALLQRKGESHVTGRRFWRRRGNSSFQKNLTVL